MARIPGYYDDIANVKKIPADRGNEAILENFQKVQANVIQEFVTLIRWRWEWERNNPSSVLEMPATFWSPILADIPRPASLSTVYYYMDRNGASEISIYCMAMICLVGVTRRLRSPFLWKAALASLSASEVPIVTNPLHFPDEKLHVFDLIRDVCRSVDFFFLMDGRGMEVDTFPVMAVLRTWCVQTSFLTHKHQFYPLLLVLFRL